MLLIVGRKIVLQKGDDEAFSVILKDAKGREVELTDSDRITLRMTYAMETPEPVSLSKPADVVTLPNKEGIYFHIIHLKSTDTADLPEGDYYYDVILEYGNKRFTIVPSSILTLEKSISLDDMDDNDPNDIQIFDTDTKIDYESIIASTPLVGSFPERSYKSTDALDDGLDTGYELVGDIITF